MAQKVDNKSDSYVIDTAKNSSQKLPSLVKKLYKQGAVKQVDSLMLSVLSVLIENHDIETIDRELPRLTKIISANSGVQAAYNLLSRIEVMFQLRKPRIGIYDHTLHIIGGGQKYGCTLAYALQNDADITFIANRKVTHQDLKRWYDLDLVDCKIKVIPLPFFEEKSFDEIDPLVINSRTENPFHLISRESGNYDIFINNSMLEKVYPLSNISILVCHFPERRRSSYFYADKYTYVVYNSKYTAEWIQKKWKIVPTTHIYPPVDLGNSNKMPEKEDIILSVARFEKGGSKQQLMMAKVFTALSQSHPKELKNWRLVLAGGSVDKNPYLEKIENFLSSGQTKNIDSRVNIPLNDLKSLYKKAKIFWHFCGFNQSDPALVEHFGMSIVESMQNWCVPIVFNGGGQREIVKQGVSGFLFSSIKELRDMTLEAMKNMTLWKDLSQGAYRRGMLFTKEVFMDKVKKLFKQIMHTYFSPPSNES